MSEEQLDPGAVLSRARPVLTFASAMRGAPELGDVRPRASTPTPPPMTFPQIAKGKRSSLPVIARIVRRTYVDDGMLRPIARVAGSARGSTLGTLVVTALVLVALGTFAGLNMRSLTEDTTAAVAAVSDAQAVERLLVRAPLEARAEAAPPVPAARPELVEAHQAHAPPVRPAPAPPSHAVARPAFAGRERGRHVHHAAVSASALARR